MLSSLPQRGFLYHTAISRLNSFISEWRKDLIHENIHSPEVFCFGVFVCFGFGFVFFGSFFMFKS